MADEAWTFAPVAGVEGGALSRDGDDWQLVLDPATTGPLTLRYFATDGLSTDDGTVTVTLAAP
jgi:hypothetical protein